MWRFGEQFDLPGPRDRGFIRLLSMLVADGMPYKKAEERIAQLLRLSRTADGRDNRTIAAGYSAAEGDGSLAALLSLFKNNPKALAAPYRVLTLGNTIGAILGVSALAIAMFAGRSWEFALGIGTVVGLATLGITFAIHKHMLKSKG